MLANMDSKYVIKYYDCFLEDGKLNIVMQYAPNGTLHSRLQAQRGKSLAEDKIWKFFIQALLGLRHVHSKKIIHRDIKSLNLFFDAEDNVLVGDLGIAKVLSPNTMFARTIVGTPYYLSPELCEDQPYNEKSDVWALGVVLYEMCTGGKHPFDAQNEGALIRKIMRGVYPPLTPGKHTTQLADVLRLCLTMDHRQRPDSAALLKHPALASRARSLGITLDPDAKNVSHRPAATGALKEKDQQLRAQQKERERERERQPLAEVPPPAAAAAQQDWDLPANPHLQQQMRPGEPHKQYSRHKQHQVHYPGRLAVGYAGVDPAYEPDLESPASSRGVVAAAAAAVAQGQIGTRHGSVYHTSDQQQPRPHSAAAAAADSRGGSHPGNIHSQQRAAATDAPPAGGAAAVKPGSDVGGLMGGYDGTDPFIAHQMARMGVGADEERDAMAEAMMERNRAMYAAKANGRGGELGNLMGGYGGDESFKAQGYGVHYQQQQQNFEGGSHVLAHGRVSAQNSEMMPPAGAAARVWPQSARPFASDDQPGQGYRNMSYYRTAAMEQSAALKNAIYEAPRFARRRAADLMITGPSMRGPGPPSRSGGAVGGGKHRGGNMGYAASMVGSECTTVVTQAPTSYYNP